MKAHLNCCAKFLFLDSYPLLNYNLDSCSASVHFGSKKLEASGGTDNRSHIHCGSMELVRSGYLTEWQRASMQAEILA
jgi:hypothetical protein